MNKLLAGQLAFIREYECKTEYEKKAMLEAIEVVQDAQKKEEINQSLLYENERLLKSAQEIIAEIEALQMPIMRDFDDYHKGMFEGLAQAREIVDEHMSWEDEE